MDVQITKRHVPKQARDRLASRAALQGNDACHVALAENLRLPLAPLDLRLSKAKGVRCDFLIPPALKLQ